MDFNSANVPPLNSPSKEKLDSYHQLRWREKADQAEFIRDHDITSNPSIATNSKQSVGKSAEDIMKELEEMEECEVSRSKELEGMPLEFLLKHYNDLEEELNWIEKSIKHRVDILEKYGNFKEILDLTTA